MRRRCSGSAAARACPQPRVQEEGNGLRDPRVAGHPAPDGAFVDPQAPGSLHLAEAQPAQDAAELRRRHGHSAVRKLRASRAQGKLAAPARATVLPTRATCPRFSPCLISSRTRRPDMSTGHFSCWRSSRKTCASLARASSHATITSVWSWPRGVACGSRRPHWRRLPKAVALALFGTEFRWVGSCSRPPRWSPLRRRSWYGRSGDPSGVSFDWSLRCVRSSRSWPSADRGRTTWNRDETALSGPDGVR